MMWSATLALTIWGATAVPPASTAPAPVPAEADDDALEAEELAEEPGGTLLSTWGLGIEFDVALVEERRSGRSGAELTFDEVGLSFTRPWLAAHLALAYETGGGELVADDAFVRLGGPESSRLFCDVGVLTLPFGDYDSHFTDDPLVTRLAETQDNAVLLGFEDERVSLALAAFTAEYAQRGEMVVVADAAVAVTEALEVGASVTSDIGESAELRELRTAHRARALGSHREDTDAVAGFAGFARVEHDAWSLQTSAATAAEAFEPDVLDEISRQPVAWDVELALSPTARVTVAGRIAGARDFPGRPDLLTGGLLACELLTWLSVVAEHDRDLRGGTAYRTTGLTLSFEFR